MYSYQRGLIKEKGQRGAWLDADLSNVPLKDLYENYDKVFLILTHPLLPNEVSLDIDNIPSNYNPTAVPLTVTQWLVFIGNGGLPTSDEIPQVDIIYAPYRDAWQAGYKIEPVNRYMHPEQNVPFADRIDLSLTKPNIDYYKLYKECLFTVNGLLHRSNFVSSAVHILDGAKNGFHCGNNLVGIYHLGVLGTVDQIPISIENVARGSELQPLKEVVYVKLNDDVDLSGKSVLLSIGGYLHVPSKMVKQSGEKTWRINFKDYPWPQRYLEMKKTIDVSSIEQHLDKSTVNEDQMAVEELYSDEAITSLFTLPQSFFIVIDTPELIVSREQLEFIKLPERYICHTEPKYPMIVGFGKMVEYWVKKEHNLNLLMVTNTLRDNYFFETTGWKEEHSIDSSRVTNNIRSYNRAHFLKIGKYV